MRSGSVFGLATSVLLFFTLAYSGATQQDEIRLQCDNAELKEWMDSSLKYISVKQCKTSDFCHFITIKQVNGSQHLFKAEHIEKVSIARFPFKPKVSRDSEIKVFHDVNDHGITQEERKSIQFSISKTHYLPYRVNSAVFMQLKHTVYGNWFVTNPLSGCDIGIVKTKGNLEPVVIHMNANSETEDEGQYHYKSKLFDSYLQHFNNIDRGSEDLFVFRIQRGYNGISAENDDENTFTYKITNLGFGLFYGTVCRKEDTRWVFVLKDGGTNDLLLQIECPLKRNALCSVNRLSRTTPGRLPKEL